MEQQRDPRRLGAQHRIAVAAALSLLAGALAFCVPRALGRQKRLQAANEELLALQSEVVSTQNQIIAVQAEITHAQAQIRSRIHEGR